MVLNRSLELDSKRRVVRRGRSRSKDEPEPVAAPFLKRTASTYDCLSEEGLTRIESEADALLADIGVVFHDHPETLKVFADAGLDVKGDLVRFDRGFCRKIIQDMAPSCFDQISRNRDKTVQIGGNAMVFAPLYGAPFVRDLNLGRRYATLVDFDNFVRLSQITPNIHHTGGTICEPTDIPVSHRHLDMAYGHIKYSDKAYMGAATSGWQVEDSIEMTRILFGAETVDKECCVLGMVNPTGPLVYDKEALESIHAYAASNQGSVVTPFIIAGASGPVTPASMLAQLLAEGLVGMALAQLVRPGAPVIFGINSMGLNMRTGAPIRYDESWKCILACGQLARRLGVPYRCGGASSTSKIPDAQAGYESALSLNYSVQAGVNFLIHAAGSLEMGLCLSYEKFLLDCEMLGAVSRMVDAIDFSDDAFAFSDYSETGPGGNFLSAKHTLGRYKTAFYDAKLHDSLSFEQWRDAGEQDAAVRASLTVEKSLKEFVAPPLDPAIDEALLEFMAKRKAVIPESFS